MASSPMYDSLLRTRGNVSVFGWPVKSSFFPHTGYVCTFSSLTWNAFESEQEALSSLAPSCWGAAMLGTDAQQEGRQAWGHSLGQGLPVCTHSSGTLTAATTCAAWSSLTVLPGAVCSTRQVMSKVLIKYPLPLSVEYMPHAYSSWRE